MGGFCWIPSLKRTCWHLFNWMLGIQDPFLSGIHPIFRCFLLVVHFRGAFKTIFQAIPNSLPFWIFKTDWGQTSIGQNKTSPRTKSRGFRCDHGIWTVSVILVQTTMARRQEIFFFGGGKVSRGWKKTYFSGGENGKLLVGWFEDGHGWSQDLTTSLSVWLWFGRFSKGVRKWICFCTCHVLKAYFMWTNSFERRAKIPVFWTGIHKSSEIE